MRLAPERASVGGLVALGLALVGTALLHPWSHFIGSDYLDADGTQWFYWWLGQALWSGEPGHTDLLFHPWGKDVLLHTGANLLDALLALPLRGLLGPVLGTNVLILLMLAGNAYGGQAVARALGAGLEIRVLGAVICLAHPFALTEINLGRPTQSMLLFPLLWIAALLRPPQAGAPWRQTLGRALLAGLWLALSGLGYWYYGLLGGLLGMAVLLARLVAGPDRVEALVRIGGAGVVALGLVLPLAWPVLSGLEVGEVPGLLALADEPGALGRLQLQTREGDPQGLSVLALSGRTGALVDAGGLRFDPGIQAVLWSHLALVLLSLVLVSRGPARGRALPLVLCMLAVLVVAFGPAVVVGREITRNNVYIALVENLDLLRRWWWPARAVAFWPPLVVALLALGLGGRSGPAWAQWLGRLFGLCVVVEVFARGLAPLEERDASTPVGIRCLATAPEGAVITLPYSRGQLPLYHQTVHQKPMLNGMLVTKDAFIPAGFLAARRDNAFLARLLALGDRKYTGLPTYDDADVDELLGWGYRYVVFRKGAYQKPGRAAGETILVGDWRRQARNLLEDLGDPAHEDDEIAIYVLGDGTLDCSTVE